MDIDNQKTIILKMDYTTGFWIASHYIGWELEKQRETPYSLRYNGRDVARKTAQANPEYIVELG